MANILYLIALVALVMLTLKLPKLLDSAVRDSVNVVRLVRVLWLRRNK